MQDGYFLTGYLTILSKYYNREDFGLLIQDIQAGGIGIDDEFSIS